MDNRRTDYQKVQNIMKRTRIKTLWDNSENYASQDLEVAGWVRSIRDMKQFGFITLNDGSCFNDLQVVIENGVLENYSEACAASVGASLKVKGVLQLTPDRPQPFELKASSVEIVGDVAPDYPIQKKHATREFLREHQHLRPRTNLFRAVFRIRSLAAYAIHSYFQERGFLYVTTPIITTSDAEGAGEMFRVTTLDLEHLPHNKDGIDWSKDFFQAPASLTVSGQLQGENFAMAFGDIYTFGPTFRAENSNTRRHAAEFWMIEPEMAFCDLDGNMEVAEGMLKFVINYVLEHCTQELAMLNKFVDKGLLERLKHVVSSDFARVTYTEAITILEEAIASGAHFDYPVSWGIDLQTEHERYLTEKHFKRPTFVTDYPKDIKAFYMKANEDGKTVAAVDCLVPGVGEILGGSVREDDFEILEKRIVDLGMDPADYKAYLDLRKYGSCEHAGFGVGFERLVMYLTGVDNIRDVLPHPRTVGSASF